MNAIHFILFFLFSGAYVWYKYSGADLFLSLSPPVQDLLKVSLPIFFALWALILLFLVRRYWRMAVRQLPPVLLAFSFLLTFMLFEYVIWLRDQPFQTSNRLQGLMVAQDYFQYPIEGLTGQVSSLIRRKNGKLSFDLDVSTIIRFNQEIKAQGRLKVHTFDFLSFGDNCSDWREAKNSKLIRHCERLKRIAPGSGVVILGSPLSLQARFSQKQNWYHHYLQEAGYDGLVYCSRINCLDSMDTLSSSIQTQDIKTFWHAIHQLRSALLRQIDIKFSQQTAPLAAAMLFGDSSFLDEQVMQLFYHSGTAHLLAASGLHLSILFAFLYFLLRRIPIISRYAPFLALMAGLFYLFLAGLRVSLARALLLVALPIVADIGQRKFNSKHALALAALLILLIDPRQLQALGFQLSFAAVAGLLWIMPPLKQLWQGSWGSRLVEENWSKAETFGEKFKILTIRGSTFLIQGLFVSFAASLLVNILLWFRMGNVQPMAPLINVLAVPLGSLLVLLIIVSIPLAYFLPELLFYPIQAWLDGLVYILYQLMYMSESFPLWQRFMVSNLLSLEDMLFVFLSTLPLWPIVIYSFMMRRWHFRASVKQSICFESHFVFRHLGAMPLGLILLGILAMNIYVVSFSGITKQARAKDSFLLDTSLKDSSKDLEKNLGDNKGNKLSNNSLEQSINSSSNIIKSKNKSRLIRSDSSVIINNMSVIMPISSEDGGRTILIGSARNLAMQQTAVDFWLLPEVNSNYLRNYSAALQKITSQSTNYPTAVLLIDRLQKKKSRYSPLIWHKFIASINEKQKNEKLYLLRYENDTWVQIVKVDETMDNELNLVSKSFNIKRLPELGHFLDHEIKILDHGLLLRLGKNSFRYWETRPYWQIWHTQELHEALQSWISDHYTLILSDSGNLTRVQDSLADGCQVMYTGFESPYVLKNFSSKRDVCLALPILPLNLEHLDKTCWSN